MWYLAIATFVQLVVGWTAVSDASSLLIVLLWLGGSALYGLSAVLAAVGSRRAAGWMAIVVSVLQFLGWAASFTVVDVTTGIHAGYGSSPLVYLKMGLLIGMALLAFIGGNGLRRTADLEEFDEIGIE